MKYFIPEGTPIIVYALETIDYSSHISTTTEQDCVIQDADRTCIISKWSDIPFGFMNNNEDVYLRFPSEMTPEGKMFWLIVLYKDAVVTE